MVFTVTYDPLPNIKLVKAVEKYPVLYNTVSHYPFRKTVDEAWERVAEEVNDTNVCCKDRWLNLRNSYKRYLRQKRSNTVKRPYYLAEHMEFLEPFIVLGEARSEKQKKDGESMSDDAETSMMPQSPDKVDNEDDSDMNIAYLDLTGSGGVDDLVISDGSNGSNISRPSASQNTCSTTVQTLVSYGLRQIATPEENFSKNPDLAFLMSLMPDVRAMTALQKKKFRKEIVNTMDNILYGQGLTPEEGYTEDDIDTTLDNSLTPSEEVTMNDDTQEDDEINKSMSEENKNMSEEITSVNEENISVSE